LGLPLHGSPTVEQARARGVQEISQTGNRERARSRISSIHRVACLALSDSVSIIEALITSIDDFVKHLTTAKFSVKKASSICDVETCKDNFDRDLRTLTGDPEILQKAGNLEQTYLPPFCGLPFGRWTRRLGIHSNGQVWKICTPCHQNW
jgi:hypothetical protein